MPVTRPRTVLFLPKSFSFMGHDNSRIPGMFFATTGDAFARKAGRKMRNTVKRLASHIVRNHGNKRKKNVCSYKYEFCYGEAILSASEEEREDDRKYRYDWYQTLYFFCFHDVKTGERRDREADDKKYTNHHAIDIKWRENNSEDSNSSCRRWKARKERRGVLFFDRESHKSIDDRYHIECS